MFNLLAALLSQEQPSEQPEVSPDVAALVVQYVVYAVIIAVSILLLILIRKKTRLPRHAEVMRRLNALLEDIKSLATKSGEGRTEFLKSVASTLYRADNLAYACTLLASKERYADIGRVASMVEDARAQIAQYRNGKREADEPEGLDAAAHTIEEAIVVMNRVIERDAEIKKLKD